MDEGTQNECSSQAKAALTKGRSTIVADKDNNGHEEDSWSETFATAQMKAYAAQQSAGAARCDVSPGDVWCTALEAASIMGIPF